MYHKQRISFKQDRVAFFTWLHYLLIGSQLPCGDRGQGEEASFGVFSDRKLVINMGKAFDCSQCWSRTEG